MDTPKILRNILLLALPSALPLSAGAQTISWPSPNKPIPFINPSTLRGADDAFGRPLAKQLSPQLNDSFVVNNRSGADSYPWLYGAVHHSIAPSIYVNLS
jgi:tripartite-type tricarboxylate transporter receptor subunit TctC